MRESEEVVGVVTGVVAGVMGCVVATGLEVLGADCVATEPVIAEDTDCEEVLPPPPPEVVLVGTVFVFAVGAIVSGVTVMLDVVTVTEVEVV